MTKYNVKVGDEIVYTFETDRTPVIEKADVELQYGRTYEIPGSYRAMFIGYNDNDMPIFVYRDTDGLMTMKFLSAGLKNVRRVEKQPYYKIGSNWRPVRFE